MAEEQNQAQGTDQSEPKVEASAKAKGAPKGKLGKALSDLLGVMFKKKPAPAGKEAADQKKPSKIKPIVLTAQKINLRTINQVMIGALAVLVILLFYVSLRERPKVSSVLAAISSIKLPEVESKTFESFQDMAYYMEEINKRDIFSKYEEKKPEPVKVVAKEPVKEPEPPPDPVVPIEEKAKDIKLMGISWGDNPKAMIRDLGTQDVQFVGVGEIIDGTDIKVKDIMKHEVILTSEGQEMSLL